MIPLNRQSFPQLHIASASLESFGQFIQIFMFILLFLRFLIYLITLLRKTLLLQSCFASSINDSTRYQADNLYIIPGVTELYSLNTDPDPFPAFPKSLRSGSESLGLAVKTNTTFYVVLPCYLYEVRVTYLLVAAVTANVYFDAHL
jgi:hypothetical protein